MPIIAPLLVGSAKPLHKPNKAGKALSRLVSIMMLGNPLGLHSQYLPGTQNVIADRISLFSSTSSVSLQFLQLQQEFIALKDCRRFHPAPNFVSYLLQALSLGQEPTPRSIEDYGHV